MRSSGRKACCQFSYAEGLDRGLAVGLLMGAAAATVLWLVVLL